MPRDFTFGIVGGLGATGRAVADELFRTTDHSILPGCRDPLKGQPVATAFGRRVSYAAVDIGDPHSLDAFCGRCSIIVNCAGPVYDLRDAVAQACLRNRCHYVDVAGLSLVKEAMAPHAADIAGLGLSFVISAGWMPGLYELLPAYAYSRSKASMDAVRSVTIFFGDSGDWSQTAMRDGVWHLRKEGVHRPRYVRNGELIPTSQREGMIKKDVGPPIGLRRYSMFISPELAGLSESLEDCEVRGYVMVASGKTVLAGMAAIFLPLSMSPAARLLGWGMRADSLPVGGFIVVEVEGEKEGRAVSDVVRMSYEQHRDYWMNALVVSTVARLITAGDRIKRGVNFLFGAVDPAFFVSELSRNGLKISGVAAQSANGNT